MELLNINSANVLAKRRVSISIVAVFGRTTIQNKLSATNDNHSVTANQLLITIITCGKVTKSISALAVDIQKSFNWSYALHIINRANRMCIDSTDNSLQCDETFSCLFIILGRWGNLRGNWLTSALSEKSNQLKESEYVNHTNPINRHHSKIRITSGESHWLRGSIGS